MLMRSTQYAVYVVRSQGVSQSAVDTLRQTCLDVYY